VQVKCPCCGKLSAWNQENEARPFCSERCKLIDLGAWASDRYAISGAVTDDDDAAPDDHRPNG
jgi:endogenous inhibitor of DNA gyrase (YacG/DUF329 family)